MDDTNRNLVYKNSVIHFDTSPLYFNFIWGKMEEFEGLSGKGKDRLCL